MRLITPITLLIIVILGSSFAIINAAEVTVHYYIGKVTMPLSFLLIFTFALGALTGVLSMLGRLLRLKKQVWQAQHARRDLAEHDSATEVPSS